VAATARRLPELEALVTEAAAEGGRIVAYPCDVTDGAGMDRLVAVVEQVHGPIALAILNAGVAPKSAASLDVATFRQVIDVNLMGVVHGLAAVHPRMAGRGRGRIAVNASLAGYRGLPGAGAYSASKAAVIALCESLQIEAGRAGIVLQVVNPGFVETPMTRDNPHPMPFLLPVETAARRLCDGLEHDRFEIAFPRRLAWIAKLFRLLPAGAYFALMRRAPTAKGEAERAETQR
jgi:NAD(P)-dependent dehydrogenase (short-subunit alcohol dehydrogenase family)